MNRLHRFSGESVLDAFLLHALLRHMNRKAEASSANGSLQLPHHGATRTRLAGALQQRNDVIAGTGQEMYAHACTECSKIITGGDGYKCVF
jgi:hypothetical protein